METLKQDIPDTIWIGFGRKDAPIVRDEARFRQVFRDWMYPHRFKIKHLEFWPGYAWGTIKMESSDARNILLKHAVEKPFRPDNESGWVLNKFEKCVPIYENSPKKSPSKKPTSSVASAATAVVASVAIKQRRATVADNLISKANQQTANNKGRKSRSSTASPATVVNYNEVLDLDDVDKKKNRPEASFEEDEDDSELRVKATITKVVNGVKVVEALTKKHGCYKLSISDIVGASKYRPNDLTGAIIVIVLGPMKKNQRRRDFLRAEISDEWKGPSEASIVATTPAHSETENNGHNNDEEIEQPALVKEETLENALVNLKRFYKWSIKDDQESKRIIAALLDEVDTAGSIQEKIAVISDHLTLASQSFNVNDADDDSIEELITSTRCSSAFSDVKRVVGSVDYDKDDKPSSRNEEYRRSDIIEDTLEEKLKQMQTLIPEEDVQETNENILNLCDSPVPPPKKANKPSGNDKKNVYDLPTSRQTIKANASSYTVESSAEIQIDMMYWQKMLHWLTIHHFDHHGEHAKDHAKWVVIVWELAGITPTNLKSEILGHQQMVTNFCTRLAEILESKKNKIPFWNNLSVSNIIHATLCYLLSKSFPAESVPRCMSRLFSTVPYINSKTGSVYQMRGYVDKYISDEKGLLMSPKGYVLFNSYAIKANEGNDETSLTVPTGTHVLFNAVKVEDSVLSEDGKRYKYFVATNVWIDNDLQVYYDDLAKQVTGLQTSVMAKVLHRANSNLSDEAILSMYEDGLSKVGKNQGKIDLKDLLVDKATMDSLQPLVDFLRTRLELRLEMASNMSLMYASMWARIGYDLEYLKDDFHSLNAIGSRGCVTYSWEKLLLNFKLPNCLEMGHLVRETLAFMSTTSEKIGPVLDLMDGKSLRDLAIKRTKVDRHHQLLTGKFDQGSLWVPQPFQRAKLLEAVLRPPPSSSNANELDKEEEKLCNGNAAKECIKVKTEGNQIYTFEANENGTLDAELVDNIIKGTIALKFKVKDDVWRIVNRKGDVFPKPPDGWNDRDYIPIKRHVTPPNSPSKTPLTPANSLAPLTPLSTSMHQQHSSSTLTPADAMILEQIRQQFQNQMQLQEHFNNIVSQQTQKAAAANKGETREELLQRHGFR